MKRQSFLGTLSAMALASSRPSPYAQAQPAPNSQARKVRALILTGGAARGSYQAGAVAGLMDRGEQFDIICGTSIGAINGALIAQGDVGALRDLWATIGTRNVLRPIPTLQPLYRALGNLRERSAKTVGAPLGLATGVMKFYDRGRVFQETGLLQAAPLADYLRSLLALERVRVPFACAATNLNASRAEAFLALPAPVRVPQAGLVRFHSLDPTSGEDRALFPEAVRASLSMPPMFPPVTLRPNGAAASEYVDGGVTLYSPVGLARELGATEIVTIALYPAGATPPLRGIFDIALRCLGANRFILLSTQLTDPALGPHLSGISVVRPVQPLKLTTLDFNRTAELMDAFAKGYADGLAGPHPLTPDDFAEG